MMSDPLDIIPDDLIDLSVVAKRLGRRPDALRSMSMRGDFPECFHVGGQSWRVSASAVRAWFAGRTPAERERSSKKRAATVRSRAQLDLRAP